MPKVKASCEAIGGQRRLASAAQRRATRWLSRGGPWVLEPAGEPIARPAMRHRGTAGLGTRQGRHDADVGDNCRLRGASLEGPPPRPPSPAMPTPAIAPSRQALFASAVAHHFGEIMGVRQPNWFW